MDDGPSRPTRGRFACWVARKPKLAVTVTAFTALIVGSGLGAAGADDATRLTELQGDLGSANAEIADVTRERDIALQDLEAATAKGEVPAYTGGSIDDAWASDATDRYGWNLVEREEASDEPVGKVIAQSVPEGKVLAHGRSITLTVAKKPPRQWTTVFEQSGGGNMRTNEFHLPAGEKVRVAYSFGGSSNSILELMKPGDDFGGDLLVNEIGAHEGTTRVYDAAGTHYLQLSGDSWSVQVQVFK